MIQGHRLRRLLRSAWLAGMLALTGGVDSARAATQFVRMVNFAFVPQSLTIHVGDSVLWTNTTATFHTTTSDRGLWDSGLFTAPGTFAVTFRNAGSFGYFCIPHRSFGMVGTITVLGPDVPPSVTIVSPANHAVLPAPATVTVQASAADADGTVANVRFFLNGGLAGTATTAPYGVTVSNLAVGSYVLTALARDNAGLFATSAPVNIKVDEPPSVVLTNPAPSAVFTAPAAFTIQASATDSDGSVTNVKFFVNGVLVGKATTAPYSVPVSNLAAGTYVLTAKAQDDAGLVGRPAPVTIKVKASSSATATKEAAKDPAAGSASADGTVEVIRFDPNPEVVGKQVHIALSVTPGHSYVVEASQTLTHWTTLTNFAAVSNAFSFPSPVLGISQRFFRARLLPNP